MNTKKHILIDEELYLKTKDAANKQNKTIESYVAQILKNNFDPIPDKIIIDYDDLQEILFNQTQIKNRINKIIDYMLKTNSITQTDMDNILKQQNIMTEQLNKSIQSLIANQSKTKTQIKKYITRLKKDVK